MAFGIRIFGLDCACQREDHCLSWFKLIIAALGAQQRTNTRLQFLLIGRLLEIIVGTSLDALQPCMQLAFDRDYNDRDLPGGGSALELIADSVAIDSWQLHIQNDEIGLVKLNGLK